ncbi:MAG: hypothetical protein GY950_21260, partial [bacterium]|nr:hypothetical protein [bacterium]
PFDLSRAPLLRVGLLERDSEIAPLLVMDMHHIVADLFSMNLFIKEFIAIYRGEELPPLNPQYKDFSLWQGRTGWEEQETYWLESLKEPAPVLNLPFDYPRPAVQQFEGAAVSFEIDKKTTALLKKMALEEEVTLFMLLLAVFNVMLAGVCDREDIPVGTPAAGRRHADLQQVIGLFVNMLVLRNRPGQGKTFREFLKEVKAKTLESFENQDYPYEVLVEKISAERDGGRNALFDVVFVWEGPEIEMDYIPPAGTGTEGLKLIPFKLEKKNAPFDLILNAGEAGGIMHFLIIYKTSLFKKETIESLGKNFTEVLSAVVNDRTVKLEEISISHDFIAAKSQSLIEDQGDFGF